MWDCLKLTHLFNDEATHAVPNKNHRPPILSILLVFVHEWSFASEKEATKNDWDINDSTDRLCFRSQADKVTKKILAMAKYAFLAWISM